MDDDVSLTAGSRRAFPLGEIPTRVSRVHPLNFGEGVHIVRTRRALWEQFQFWRNPGLHQATQNSTRVRSIHASPPATPPPLSLDRGRRLVSMWFGRSPTRLVPTTRRNRRFDMPRIAQTGQVGRLSRSLLSHRASTFSNTGTSRWLERRFSKYAHANATHVPCVRHVFAPFSSRRRSSDANIQST